MKKINLTKKSKNPIVSDVLLLSESYSSSKNSQQKIRLSTNVAYSMLSSKHRYICAFGTLAAFSVSLCLVITLAFSTFNKFSDAFNLSFLLNNGQNYIDISQVASSFTAAWINLILLFACAVICFISVLLIIKFIRIYIEFNKNNLYIVPLDKEN